MRSEMVIQNTQATMPLRIGLSVECNTSDEKILSNVLANSKRIHDWVKLEDAHDGVAVICGGGPSLAESLDELSAISGTIFALNGAASYLWQNQIKADYQVLMDAQPETAKLIGPAHGYLFASQVDPECFREIPWATLWHCTYGNVRVDEQDGFPEHGSDYCLIGASISVGNTTLALAYAMGYRTIHVFGMDSSHRGGAGHAYAQPMNDGDPCTIVEFGGKEYTCSLTMELQARNFRQRADQLKAAGCTIIVHGNGLLPAMANAPDPSEVEKYERMWAHDDYRNVAPGEDSAGLFLDVVKPDGPVIDFGCGTGRGALRIAEEGHEITLVDFAGNCRDEAAKALPFVKHDLTKPLNISAPYGYCTDVMEHIPTGDVEDVIRNILDAANTTFFQISTVPDSFGAVIGHPLHLTVRPHGWWRRKFIDLGYRVTWEDAGEINSSFLVKMEIAA